MGCRTDITIGRGHINNGPVTSPPGGTQMVSATINMDTGALVVTAPIGIIYALRLFGGAGIEQPPSDQFAKTKNCNSQAYTVNGTREGRGYRFRAELGVPGEPFTFATVVWTAAPWSDLRWNGPGVYAVNASRISTAGGLEDADGGGLVGGELDRGLGGAAVPGDMHCGINDNLKLSIEDCTTSACRHKQSPMMNVTFEGYPTCVEAYSIASDGEVEISVGAPKDCLTQVLGRIFGSAKAWNSLDISALRGPTAGTHGFLFRCVM